MCPQQAPKKHGTIYTPSILAGPLPNADPRPFPSPAALLLPNGEVATGIAPPNTGDDDVTGGAEVTVPNPPDPFDAAGVPNRFEVDGPEVRTEPK